MKKLKFVLVCTIAFTAVNVLTRIVFDGEFSLEIVGRGLLSSLFFSLLLLPVMRFMKVAEKKPAKTIEGIALKEGEDILLKSRASHVTGWEAVRGILMLTNKRLLFSSHQFSQDHKIAIPLDEVTFAGPESYKSETFLLIGLSDNGTQRFLVESPGEWIKMLSNKASVARMNQSATA